MNKIMAASGCGAVNSSLEKKRSPGWSFIAIGAILVATGCALFLAKETVYLRSAQDRATQQEVRGHLGNPLWAGSLRAGETVWVYQIREPEMGGNDSSTIVGSWCDEYVLTFDAEGVLRRWTHRSQKHRDGRFHGDCVNDGFRPPS
ncbi:MAG: hypothetical protein NW701_11415 [Nitrospira sp.]